MQGRLITYRTGAAAYTAEMQYKSSWTALSTANNVLVDPRLLTFFANRQSLYSARAGNPNIVEYWPLDSNHFSQDFEVVGQHWYRDPVNNTQSYLGISKANSCNLSNWGFSLADR